LRVNDYQKMAPLWVRICFQQRKTNGPFMDLVSIQSVFKLSIDLETSQNLFLVTRGQKFSECPGNKGLIFNFRLILMFLFERLQLTIFFVRTLKDKNTQQVRTKRERLSLLVMPHFGEHVAQLVDTKKKNSRNLKK
jgi:hypothetical protein